MFNSVIFRSFLLFIGLFSVGPLKIFLPIPLLLAIAYFDLLLLVNQNLFYYK